MKEMVKGKRAKIKIEKLVYRGEGLGYWEGKAVFVPYTLPGEVVVFEIVQEKRRFIRGRLVSVLEASSDRISPSCSAFGRCGGCQWQHIRYEKQIEWKHKILREILGRTLGLPEDRVNAPIPSYPYGYRSRARLIWDEGEVGFRSFKSHRLVPVARCPLLVRPLEHLQSILEKKIKRLSPFSQTRGDLLLEAGDGGHSRVIFRFHTSFAKRENRSEKLREVFERETKSAVWVEEANGSLPVLVVGEDLLFLTPWEGTSLRLRVPPGGFFQANLNQNRRLTALVLEEIERLRPTRPLKILDLFCGMGNFSLPVASLGHEVVGVEVAASSIEAAKENAVSNRLGAVSFFCEKAERYIEELSKKGEIPFDVLILDPPRVGAKAIAEILARSDNSPLLVLYISCDPMTLARDLKILAPVYEIESVKVVDMFPQTFHIETLAVLKRK